MRVSISRQAAGLVLAAWAAGATGGCATTVPPSREAAVSIRKVERIRWDLPPEPGLYRVSFDAQLSLEIRRQAEAQASTGSVDGYHAEIRVMEGEAERELRARHLCGGSVKMVIPREPGDGSPALSAIFRCGVSFF